MANTKYAYVKQYEENDKCLLNCWIIVRLDGRNFRKFAAKHKLEKPNDERCLRLMISAATAVMKDFTDIVLAFGESDEFSFVFRRETEIYRRRKYKILSSISSCFAGYFVLNWPQYFSIQLLYPPTFDGRLVLYPTNENMRDYLAWRQADTHINNLYNTCFWNLVRKSKLTHKEAHDRLNNTLSSEKNEILFQEFGINYNKEPEIFRKGTTLYRDQNDSQIIYTFNGDIIQDSFWETHLYILLQDSQKRTKSQQFDLPGETVKGAELQVENEEIEEIEIKHDEINERGDEAEENKELEESQSLKELSHEANNEPKDKPPDNKSEAKKIERNEQKPKSKKNRKDGGNKSDEGNSKMSKRDVNEQKKESLGETNSTPLENTTDERTEPIQDITRNEHDEQDQLNEVEPKKDISRTNAPKRLSWSRAPFTGGKFTRTKELSEKFIKENEEDNE